MAAPRRGWKLFDVRAGEGRRLLTIGGSMAAILAAHTIAETARDAMFLQKVPTKWLSLVYVALAVLAYGGLLGSQWLIRRVGREHALVSTLMAAAFGAALFYIVRSSAEAAFGLYLWTGLLGSIVIVQFWMLAGSLFTTGEAKRVFGLVASMGAVGALLGALLATALLEVIYVEKLLPVASGFYLLAGVVLTKLPEPATSIPSRPQRAQTVSSPVRLRDNPYVIRLALIGMCATAAALVSDYLLKTTAAAHFAPSELPGFFARYASVVTTLSLVLQLVGASFLLRKVGVLGGVMLLPAALLIGGTVAIFTAGMFLVIAFTKGADETLRHSINRVSGELLWMPVSASLRSAIREPLDSVVARVVQAVTAGSLFALTVFELASPVVLTGILIGIAALWLVVGAGLRPSYMAQLRSTIVRPQFDTEHELDIASIEMVVEALSSTDERRVIAAVRVLQGHNRARLIPGLLLRHDSPEVLVVALEAIAVRDRTDWIPLTQRLLDAERPSVRIAAIRALARHGHHEAVRKGLADGDPVVRASALFWEANTSDARDLTALAPVAALLEADDADSGTVRRILVEAIRDDGGPRWSEVLFALSKHEDPALVVPIARAIERVPDARFVPYLIERLGTRAGRSDVRAALLAVGEPALEALEKALGDPALSTRVQLHLPTTIAKFDSQRAADILVARLATETAGAIRYRLLRAVARLAIHRANVRLPSAMLLEELVHHVHEHFRVLGLFVAFEPDLDTTTSAQLLRGLLRDKISQARDRVLLVLATLHPREDVRSIGRAFESGDRATRSHAMEFLDNLLRAEVYGAPKLAPIRKAVLLAFEDLLPKEQVARGTLERPPATSAEAVTHMLRDGDALLAACAAYHALQLGPSPLADRVREIAQQSPLLAPLGLASPGAVT